MELKTERAPESWHDLDFQFSGFLNVSKTTADLLKDPPDKETRIAFCTFISSFHLGWRGWANFLLKMKVWYKPGAAFTPCTFMCSNIRQHQEEKNRPSGAQELYSSPSGSCAQIWHGHLEWSPFPFLAVNSFPKSRGACQRERFQSLDQSCFAFGNGGKRANLYTLLG